MDERLVQFDEKMQKTMNNLSEEFGSIRAGRANPHVLDKLRVDYYGTPTPIQQVANVNVPEPRMIQIQPWEASMVKEIEKVIMTSDLGINPTNDGKTPVLSVIILAVVPVPHKKCCVRMSLFCSHHSIRSAFLLSCAISAIFFFLPMVSVM